ncbi:hypothetical protein FACS189454_03290 [Planctomycetales bacterium]|nr:hypothetical protein FACS189454_03290 [Planctomycetales bacterium]
MPGKFADENVVGVDGGAARGEVVGDWVGVCPATTGGFAAGFDDNVLQPVNALAATANSIAIPKPNTKLSAFLFNIIQHHV